MNCNDGRVPGLRAALVATTILASAGGVSAQEATTGAIELGPVSVEGKAEKDKDILTGPVVGQEEIDRRQPKDLRGLFDNQPAVRVGGGQAASQKLYVHGVEQGKLNVTVDGAAQPSNIWHHNGTMTLDPYFLKRASVDAGVAPADAGPGAIAGAVRMETKDARDMLLPGRDVGGAAILGYNTNSEALRTTGAGYAVRDGFEILGIGSRVGGDNYVNGDGRDETGTKDNLLSGLAKLGYEAPAGHRLMVSGEFAEDDAVRRYRPNMSTVNSANLMNPTRSARLALGTTYTTTKPSDRFDPKLGLNFTRTTLHRPPVASATSGVMNASINTFNVLAQNTFTVGGGKLTAGFDLRDDKTHVGSYSASIGDSDEERRNFGAFLQARFNPLERLKVSTGLRVDYQQYDSVDDKEFNDAGVSPNLSGEYALTGGLSLFGGYNYVWGGLELPEMGLFHVARYRYNDDLEAVRAHNGRVGLRYAQDGLGIEGALFRSVILNPLTTDDTARVRRNGAALMTRGFDFSSKYDWANAGVFGKYTYTDIKYASRMARPNDYNSGVPVGHIVNLGGHYTFQPVGVTVGGSLEWAADIQDSSLTEGGFQSLKSYHTVDLFTEWTPVEAVALWTLRAEANNLLDRRYVDRGSASLQTSPAVTPVLAEGRSFNLVSTLRF